MKPAQVVRDHRLLGIYSPLQTDEWRRHLQDHPDQQYVAFLLRGMESGFRVGFNRAQKLGRSRYNMKSALEHPAVVDQYLKQELQHHRVLGPFIPQDCEGLGIHVNRFGVIPKKHTSNKWRLIVDLSSPEQRSINDGIDPALSSLSYIRVEQVARSVLELGPGAQLAKIDIKSTYRIIPVHPDDRPLLGMH